MARLSTAQEKALYDWASAAAGVQVIWDKQQATSPALPYVTLGFNGGPRMEGKPEMLYKQLDTYYYNVRYVFTLTVNIYAQADYLAIMDALQESLIKDTVLAALRVAGLVYRGNEPPVDVSEVQDTAFEFRTAADFFFAFGVVVEDETGEIQRVQATGTFGNVTRELDINSV